MSAVLSFPVVRELGDESRLMTNTVDLSDLSEAEVHAVKEHLGQIRVAQRRIGQELVYMAVHMHRLHDMLGAKRWEAFVEAELDISARTARRYLHIHRIVQVHFLDEKGRAEFKRVQNISQRAFNMLAADTDDAVIAEIKEITDKGGKVDEATVKQLLAERDRDYEARIATADATAEAAQRELQDVRTKHELETSRLARQLESTNELLRRAEQERSLQERELEEMRKATIIEEKIVEKEVIPEGYATVMDAVTAEQKRLAEIQERCAQTQQQIAELERQRQNLAELQAGAEELLKLREQIESIMLKYPIARMQAISSTDQTNKSLIDSLGATMIELGKQLLAGTAK